MRNLSKVKIADWLVHGGHQYEFFKTGPSFYCTGKSGKMPSHTDLGRPLNKNVKFVNESYFSKERFNIIMIRAGIRPEKLNLLKRKSRGVGIAVMQTHTPFKPPSWTRCIVWNSKVSMDRFRKQFPRQMHFYIPHGFDPNEFNFLNLNRNQRVLSASSYFEERARFLGFGRWRWVSSKLGKCDLLGHGNGGLAESIGSRSLSGLVNAYNQYSVFLNTTTKSAMPRARAEALMCGTPLVTTNNFGIGKYLVNKKSCLFADTKEDMLASVKKILDSKSMQRDLGSEGRAAAIKHFHIKDYISRWQHVFDRALR